MSTYQVIVGNVGTVYNGDNFGDAQREYVSYCELSETGYGRVSGEPVTLMENGEPIAPDNDQGFIRRIVSLPELPKFLCRANDSLQVWNPYNSYQPHEVSNTSYSDYSALTALQDADMEPIEELYVIPGLLTYGDYCDMGFIGKANFQCFQEEYGEHFDELNIHTVSGGYGSESIAIPVTLLVQEECNLCGDDQPCELCQVVNAIRETFDALESYPCIDDEKVSELEIEDWDEQYDDWGRNDFIGELEKRFSEYELDDADETAVDKLFYQLCEDTGTYPEADGNSMYIRLDDICREVSRVDVSAIPGVKFEPDNVDELGDELRDERKAYFEGYHYAVIMEFGPNEYRKEVNSGTSHQIYREHNCRSYIYRIEFPLPNMGTPMLPGFELSEIPENVTHIVTGFNNPTPLCNVIDDNPSVEKFDRTKVSCPQCRVMMRERN